MVTVPRVTVQYVKVTRADPTFGRLVLGYTAPELAGRGIEELLPGFYDEFEVPSCDRTEDEDLGCENLSQHRYRLSSFL